MSPPYSGSKNKSGRKLIIKTIGLPNFRNTYERRGKCKAASHFPSSHPALTVLKNRNNKIQLINVSDVEFQ
jgi:hypothetical protein